MGLDVIYAFFPKVFPHTLSATLSSEVKLGVSHTHSASSLLVLIEFPSLLRWKTISKWDFQAWKSKKC